jgi:hypothetical protein
MLGFEEVVLSPFDVIITLLDPLRALEDLLSGKSALRYQRKSGFYRRVAAPASEANDIVIGICAHPLGREGRYTLHKHRAIIALSEIRVRTRSSASRTGAMLSLIVSMTFPLALIVSFFGSALSFGSPARHGKATSRGALQRFIASDPQLLQS